MKTDKELLEHRGWSTEGAGFILSHLEGEEESNRGLRNLIRRLRNQPSEPKKYSRYQKRPIPRSLAKKVYERDGYRCVTCRDWHNLSIDHILAESKGGEATYENLQTMCLPCNMRKGAR